MLLPNLCFSQKMPHCHLQEKAIDFSTHTNPYELTKIKKEKRIKAVLVTFLNNGISYPAYGYFVNNKCFENPKHAEFNIKY